MAKSGFSVTLAVTKLQSVKDLCQIITDMYTDDRIPLEVREELAARVEGVLNRMNVSETSSDSKGQRYKCLDCDHQGYGSRYRTDGIACERCKGPVMPLP